MSVVRSYYLPLRRFSTSEFNRTNWRCFFSNNKRYGSLFFNKEKCYESSSLSVNFIWKIQLNSLKKIAAARVKIFFVTRICGKKSIFFSCPNGKISSPIIKKTCRAVILLITSGNHCVSCWNRNSKSYTLFSSLLP